jgi:hypothetical protein
MTTISNRRFKMKPNPKGAWDDIQPNFGVIKGLRLDMLEFASKIKKNAPIIPEPTYSGKAFDEPKVPLPPPTSGGAGATASAHASPGRDKKASEVVESDEIDKKRVPVSTQSSESDDGEYDSGASAADDDDFINRFGDSPTKEIPADDTSAIKKAPKYIPIPKVNGNQSKTEEIPESESKEKDPTEVYIEEEVERRMNIDALRKAKKAGIEMGEVEDDMDLQTTRILRKTTDKQVAHNNSVSMNRFALMGIFLGVDQGFSLLTDKMKGYLEFQLNCIKIYDPYLEAIGENSINSFLQALDPSLQLVGVICVSTGAFYIFQNFVGEDKVKGAKLIKSFFPSQAGVIDEITTASKKVKEGKEKEAKSPKKEDKPKKRRGPTFSQADINNAE